MEEMKNPLIEEEGKYYKKLMEEKIPPYVLKDLQNKFSKK